MHYTVTNLSNQDTLIAVAGLDAARFLQGQLTCNLTHITPSMGALGAYCNQKGRLHGIFHLFQYQEIYYLHLPTDNAPVVLNTLKKYGQFSKITVNLCPEQSLWGLLCPKEQMVQIPWSALLPVQPYECSVHQQTFYMQLTPSPSHRRFLCLSSTESIEPLTQAGALTAEPVVWNEHRVLAKVPSIYAETAEHFLPHPLNLAQLGAISFDKGCYLGQEIIARTHYRGSVKKHMHLAIIDTAEKPALKSVVVQQDQPVGEIIDITPCLDNSGFLSLIVLNDQQEQDPLLSLASNGAAIRLLHH